MRKSQFVAKIQNMFSPKGVEDPRLSMIGYTETAKFADELWPWTEEFGTAADAGRGTGQVVSIDGSGQAGISL